MRQAGEPGIPARDGRAGAMPLRRIGFLLMPEFTLIAFTAAVEALRMANRLSGKRLYEWQVLSVTGGPVHASNGLVFTADTSLAMAGTLDLVLVCGGERIEQHTDRTLLAGLRRLAATVPRLGAICTGSHALARAGLLDGYRCTIHWENLASFREQFPSTICSQELLEIDRERYTCSGGTAPLDLMLNIVQRDHGAALATAISEEFLCERIRGRHDRQRIPLRLTLGTSQPKLMETVALMEANLEEPMSLDELSAAVGLSRRQLERLFQKYLKCAPTRYYLDLRLHKARQLLLQTDMSVVDVALASGFVSAPHFSKCYRDYFAKPPRDERRRKEAEAVRQSSQGS